jgi:hypothetical protein
MKWLFDFPSLSLWCPRFRMFCELRKNLNFCCYCELLLGDKFKQVLTIFFWVSKMFICWKILKGVGVLEMDKLFCFTLM